MREEKQTQLEGFRSAIEDSLSLIDKLSSYCQSIEELQGLLTHALDNQAQLKILLTTLTRK